MSVSLIVATDKNSVIGIGNNLPWHIPAEMKHFKEQTLNKTVLMGRKTWESIPEKYRPLPDRTNVVITTKPGNIEGADFTYGSIEDALENHDDVVVMGGAAVYEECFKKGLIDTVILSTVDEAASDGPDNVYLRGFDKSKFFLVTKVVHDEFTVRTYAIKE